MDGNIYVIVSDKIKGMRRNAGRHGDSWFYLTKKTKYRVIGETLHCLVVINDEDRVQEINKLHLVEGNISYCKEVKVYPIP